MNAAGIIAFQQFRSIDPSQCSRHYSIEEKLSNRKPTENKKSNRTLSETIECVTTDSLSDDSL